MTEKSADEMNKGNLQKLDDGGDLPAEKRLSPLDQINIVKEGVVAVGKVSDAAKSITSDVSRSNEKAVSSVENISAQSSDVLRILAENASTPEERSRVADSFDRYEEQKTRRIEALGKIMSGFFAFAWKAAGVGALVFVAIAQGKNDRA